MDAARRQQLTWTLLFAVPPGIGMTGFVAVGLAGGALTTGAVAAGLATTLVIGLFLFVVFSTGSPTGTDGPDTS